MFKTIQEVKMIKIGIVGGTGYTGVELLRLLAQHPQAHVEVITSRSENGIRVVDMYPNLRGHYDQLCFSVPDTAALGACDVVFFATPHGVAHAMAAAFALGEEAGGVATLVKMSRVMLLVPVMLILSRRFHGTAGGLRRGFPMYILLFLGATVIGGFDLLPEQLGSLCDRASSLLILMASCAMGLSVRFRGVLRRGALALGLASLLFLLFSGAGLAAVLWLL